MRDAGLLCLVVGVLTALDVAGAIALKEASLRSSPALALAGVGAFVALALMLYFALEITELTVVSLAWVVAYQVAATGVDIVFYHVVPGRIRLIAIVVAMLALTVAAVAPARTPPPRRAIPWQRWPTLSERMADDRHPSISANLRLLPLPLPRPDTDTGSPDVRRRVSGSPATPRPAFHG